MDKKILLVFKKKLEEINNLEKNNKHMINKKDYSKTDYSKIKASRRYHKNYF